MPKLGEKTIRKKPFQIRWDRETEDLFHELVTAYDEDLPVAAAIIKLVKNAVKEWALPGYVRIKKREVVANEITEKLNRLSKSS